MRTNKPMVEKVDGSENWSFPDINGRPAVESVFVPLTDRLTEVGMEGEVAQEVVENKDDIINKLREENQALQIELQKYTTQVAETKAINEMVLERLSHASTYIDDEIVDLIKQFVKSITEKTTRKVFDQDMSVLNSLIDELKKNLDNQSGPITIFLCEKDYQRLQADNNPLLSVIKPDKLLNVGDVIIRSNCTEIRSVISESIDKFLG